MHTTRFARRWSSIVALFIADDIASWRLFPPPPVHDEDCSTCSEGYSLGFDYSCLNCSTPGTRLTKGLAAAAVVVVLLVVVTVLWQMGVMQDSEPRQRQATPEGRFERMLTYFRVLATKAPPLTATKIVVVVWQIIFQV